MSGCAAQRGAAGSADREGERYSSLVATTSEGMDRCASGVHQLGCHSVLVLTVNIVTFDLCATVIATLVSAGVGPAARKKWANQAMVAKHREFVTIQGQEELEGIF